MEFTEAEANCNDLASEFIEYGFGYNDDEDEGIEEWSYSFDKELKINTWEKVSSIIFGIEDIIL